MPGRTMLAAGLALACAAGAARGEAQKAAPPAPAESRLKVAFLPPGEYPYRISEARDGVWQFAFNVRVTDEAGDPVRTLTPESFTFAVNGQDVTRQLLRRQVERTQVGPEPLYLALVVDVSTSVQPVYESQVLASARALLAGLRQAGANVVVQVFAAGAQVGLVQDSTQDLSQAEAALPAAAETAGEATALNEALYAALARVPPKAERKAIVAFTDARNEGSTMAPAAVTDRARQLQCPIFIVTASVDALGGRSFHERDAENLTRYSGGRSFAAGTDPAAIQQALAEATAADYAVTVELGPDLAPADSIERTLSVAASVGEKAGQAAANYAISKGIPTWTWLVGAAAGVVLLTILAALLIVVSSRRGQAAAAPAPAPQAAPEPARASECPACGDRMFPGQTMCRCGWTAEAPPATPPGPTSG